MEQPLVLVHWTVVFFISVNHINILIPRGAICCSLMKFMLPGSLPGSCSIPFIVSPSAIITIASVFACTFFNVLLVIVGSTSTSIGLQSRLGCVL